jgi:hypothetical protein
MWFSPRRGPGNTDEFDVHCSMSGRHSTEPNVRDQCVVDSAVFVR